jgi:2-methylcitrate dehydratase PrpD
VLKLRARAQRPADDIESIRAGVTAPGYQMVCMPEQVRLAPSTIVEAQFSIPYTVAAAWIDGRLGMKHFSDEGLQRADVLALAARVQPYVDEEIDRDWHRFVTPGRVIVRFRDGQTIEERVDYPKGHPNNPMSDSEFATKTADCASFAAKPMPLDIASRLTATVRKLESQSDIAELVGVLS